MARPQPLALTDRQFAAVVAACEPLLPTDRDAFLRALAHRLQAERCATASSGGRSGRSDSLGAFVSSSLLRRCGMAVSLL